MVIRIHICGRDKRPPQFSPPLNGGVRGSAQKGKLSSSKQKTRIVTQRTQRAQKGEEESGPGPFGRGGGGGDYQAME